MNQFNFGEFMKQRGFDTPRNFSNNFQWEVRSRQRPSRSFSKNRPSSPFSGNRGSTGGGSTGGGSTGGGGFTGGGNAFSSYNWGSLLNATMPNWGNVMSPNPEFQNVRLASPRQDILNLGKAMDFDKGGGDYISKESLTSSRLNEILNKDNPYIQRARNEALRHANKMGLLSSSLAINAAEDAAIKNALPIAQHEAEALMRGDLARQEAEQKSKLAEQGFLSNLGQMQQQAEYNAAAQIYDTMSKKQQQEFAALMDEYLQAQKLGAQGIWNQEEYQRKADLLERELRNRLLMQEKEIASQEKLAQQQMANELTMLKEKYRMEESLQNARNKFEAELAKMGYDNATNQNILNNAGNLTNQYLSSYSSVLTDPNIDDNYRQQYLDNLTGIYTVNMNGLLTLGGVT